IGTGILATAFKRDAIAEGEDAYAALVSSTTTSNRRAADVARAFDVHAATDVTGYGLLGHLLEMIGASQTAHADSSPSDVDVELDASSVPLLEGARALTEKGFAPGGSTANLAFAAPSIAFDCVDEVTRVVLADAQTSGGVLLALPPHDASAFVERFGAPAAIVGRVVSGAGRVRVTSR
ncbi:MAG: AIR synthase-related protein, partial [Polyangiales bacterium]